MKVFADAVADECRHYVETEFLGSFLYESTDVAKRDARCAYFGNYFRNAKFGSVHKLFSDIVDVSNRESL